MLLEVLLLEVLLLELVEPLPVVCPGAPWDVPLLWLLGPGCARAAAGASPTARTAVATVILLGTFTCFSSFG